MVGAGDHPELAWPPTYPPPAFRGYGRVGHRREVAGVGDEGLAVAPKACRKRNAGRAGPLWPKPDCVGGRHRPRGGHNCRRPRAWRARLTTSSSSRPARRCADRRSRRALCPQSRSKISKFQVERALADWRSWLRYRKPAVVKRTGPRQRLAVDEISHSRRLHQFCSPFARGHLEEIAEHIVVADLRTINTCESAVARLHRRDTRREASR